MNLGLLSATVALAFNPLSAWQWNPNSSTTVPSRDSIPALQLLLVQGQQTFWFFQHSKLCRLSYLIYVGNTLFPYSLMSPFYSWYTQCLEKTVQNCFCQNFFKFPPILIIFGRKMAKRLKLYEVHSFSTSPNSCHHTTMFSADVPNCHTTLKGVTCYRQHCAKRKPAGI